MMQCSALLAAHSVATPARAKELRKRTQHIARKLKNTGSALNEVARLWVELQLAALERDEERLNECLTRLRKQRGAGGNPLHEAGFELAGACLKSDQAKVQALQIVCNTFSEQGWQEPKKAIAMLWPGLAQL